MEKIASLNGIIDVSHNCFEEDKDYIYIVMYIYM